MDARMTDVAERAGVSIKTVSRVLNNEPHVSADLRDRVLEAVDTLGYVPSNSARSLRSSRSYAIHLVTQSLRSTFHNEIQFGALSACEKAGYRMVVSMIDEGDTGDAAFLARWAEGVVRAGKPDGMILVPPMASDPVFGAIAERLDIPLASIGSGRLGDGRVAVGIDDRAAAREMTDHLIGQGHRRIAFVLGKADQESTHTRRQGFQEAMRAFGLEVDPALILPGRFEFESGLDAGERLLTMDHPPTAVFAANDDMAAGVIVAAHRRSVPLPDGLSVAGFDDTEIAEKMWPALTTIRQPLRELGATAMRALIRPPLSDEPRPDEPIILPYELVVRQSTGPAPR